MTILCFFTCHSTAINDVDEKGLRHMVLCRVILGNVELIQSGSKQFYPSDPCFDSGVDDLQTPNNYVIWNMNMNTHIFPECVVSFKMSPTIKGFNSYSSTIHEIGFSSIIFKLLFTSTLR